MLLAFGSQLDGRDEKLRLNQVPFLLVDLCLMQAPCRPRRNHTWKPWLLLAVDHHSPIARLTAATASSITYVGMASFSEVGILIVFSKSAGSTLEHQD
jgi:hypothetical protein